MEVDLGTGDFVFDGEPATPRKRAHPLPTQFLAHVYCGQTAGWRKTSLGMDVDLVTGHNVLDGSQLSAKGAQQPPPLFSAHLLWPRSPISATAERLFIIISTVIRPVLEYCVPV